MLFEYFKIALVPLDQVIFSYSVKEMMMITGNCVKINFLTFIPFISFILLTLILLFLSQKLKIAKYISVVYIILSSGCLLFKAALIPKESQGRNPFEYYLSVNKSAYLAGKCKHYFLESRQSASAIIVEDAIKRYHVVHPEFKFLGYRYPFLHYDNTPDVLSNFFNLKKEKPNLVFIICESLSSCFSGNNILFGSFTPFLDSLATQGLYWPNFLSSADRTFNVLPAIFGSLPPGDATFFSSDYVQKLPYHLSLIRYLHDGGYYTSFFYAGDPSFNNMEHFLKLQETDYILKSFGSKYEKEAINEGYGWGYSDVDLFKRSFEVKDSVKKSPRLDIYLTLSLHAPFIVPNDEYYLSKVDEILKKRNPNDLRTIDIKNDKNIFATILYTDQALKNFFESYKKRPEFSNTIFIITGDHGMPELNLPQFSGMEPFHVPLIIYSPMLQSRRPTFYSVSSHLDIAPTILAMLHEKFGLKINSAATWLGSGIDTSRVFGNVHILPFILNSKEIPTYLNHMFFINPQGLGKILPGLFQEEQNDQRIRKELNQELEDFKILNKYVARQNRLIPPEIYFGKALLSDTLKLKDTVTFNPNLPIGEWKSLLHAVSINSKFKLLKLEVTIEFMISKAFSGDGPLVIFDLKGKADKRVLWKSINFPLEALTSKNYDSWRTAKIEEYIDLSYLHEVSPASLFMYIWNHGQEISRIRKSEIKIIGYY